MAGYDNADGPEGLVTNLIETAAMALELQRLTKKVAAQKAISA